MMKIVPIRAIATVLVATPLAAPQAATNDGEINSAKLQELAQRIGKVSDANEIERFQYIYGYQQDHFLMLEQTDLVSKDSVHRYKNGVYYGKAGAQRFWPGRGGGMARQTDMPIFGSLIDHHESQPVITVSDDRMRVRARFRNSTDRYYTQAFGGADSENAKGADQSSWYENEYIREDGVWKIYRFNVCLYAEGSTRAGYADLPEPGKLGTPEDAGPEYWKDFVRTTDDTSGWNVLYPKNPLGPDKVETGEEAGCFFPKNQTMVHSVVLPFHFPNPVTGESVTWKNK
ncbi:MAG: nuclear transport factor 2 family protein, partial [Croceibacterium sp.]